MGSGSSADSTVAVAIVGASAATTSLKADIARVARYSSNILITGPSGTGKELVARQIHAVGGRASQPFIPVDCASMTGELMASQLFGHVAGAFTGANCAALGCVRAANRGTLFLDEIGELDYALQAKLLRVLQERTVTPVGSHQGERVDVQVIAATNRNLRDEVRSWAISRGFVLSIACGPPADDGVAGAARGHSQIGGDVPRATRGRRTALLSAFGWGRATPG